MTKIMSSAGFLAKLKFSSEFCGKWGIRLECTVCMRLQKKGRYRAYQTHCFAQLSIPE